MNGVFDVLIAMSDELSVMQEDKAQEGVCHQYFQTSSPPCSPSVHW